MPLDIVPSDLPVLLLSGMDASWTDQEKEEVAFVTRQLEEAIAAVGHPTELLMLTDGNLAACLQSYDPTACIVFNWCENIPGKPRSEFLVAKELEQRSFAFTGAGSQALVLAGDKSRVKRILRQRGIPTPEWRLFRRPEPKGWTWFPAIVKAAYEHCSEGLTRESVVMTAGEMARRIEYVLDTYRQPAMVEDFIDGREFHVSLWGNGHIEMLPPAEMDFSLFKEAQDRLCTYESKFVPGSKHYECIETLLPAPLTDVDLLELEKVCRAAYQAGECRDYGRIDVRLRDGLFYVLDVNPNADISADASLACAAELAGYSYGETGSRIARLAAKRHPRLGKAKTHLP